MAGVCSGCAYMPRLKPADIETGYITYSFKSEVTGQDRSYAMVVPNEYRYSRRDWPLIVFLHGMGERGDNIDQVLVHGPLKQAMVEGNLEFLMVAPQCPKPQPDAGRMSMMWPQNEADVLRILDEVQIRYNVDKRRIYLTGLSMGGNGCFALAASRPDLFAAVAPICGWGDAGRVAAYQDVPFWIFHGMKDEVVPHNRSVEMAETMKAMGQEVQLKLYPDAGHDSWTETYENEQLYAWFLSHKRKPGK